MTGARIISTQSLAALVRERTVLLVIGMFSLMVLVSAWLGWSATHTVDTIYADAAAYLTSVGEPVPPNPVSLGSPLAVLRNVTVYVGLIGTFAAIVIGQRLIEGDRRAGVLPLIGTRPLTRAGFARGKIGALCLSTAVMTVVAAAISFLTLAFLPGAHVAAADWGRLAVFFLLAWGYMTLFGLVALGAAARVPAMAGGLLAATVLWLAITFVLPAITGNVNPTAAINPISGLAVAPDTPLFTQLGFWLGPVSLSEHFNYLSADLMGYRPDGLVPRGPMPPLVCLVGGLIAAGGFALTSCLTLDPNAGGPDA